MKGPLIFNQINPSEIFQDGKGPYRAEFFVYNLDFTIPAVAAPTVPGQIQTQTDADFVWSATTYNLFTAAAADETVTNANLEIPDLRVQVLDAGSGKNFFFNPASLPAIASNNINTGPTIQPVGRIIKAGATLSFTVTSMKTWAAAYNLQIDLWGYKKLRDVG